MLCVQPGLLTVLGIVSIQSTQGRFIHMVCIIPDINGGDCDQEGADCRGPEDHTDADYQTQ